MNTVRLLLITPAAMYVRALLAGYVMASAVLVVAAGVYALVADTRGDQLVAQTTMVAVGVVGAATATAWTVLTLASRAARRLVVRQDSGPAH